MGACVVSPILTAVTVDDFKSLFDRDFKFGATIPDIRDKDIDKAFAEAQAVLNVGLYNCDENVVQAYLYLSAHYLVQDINGAGNTAGLNSEATNPITSKGVGSVSVSYSIPEYITKDPTLSYFATTSYGNKFLSLSIPNLRGNINFIEGATLP